MAGQAGRDEGLAILIGEGERIDVPPRRIVVGMLGQGGLVPVKSGHHAPTSSRNSKG